jgi:hypothetical protein
MPHITPGGAYTQDWDWSQAVMLPIAATQTFTAGSFVYLVAGQVTLTPTVSATSTPAVPGYVDIVAVPRYFYGIAMVSSYDGNTNTGTSLATDTLIPVLKIHYNTEIELPVCVGTGTALTDVWATTTHANALVGVLTCLGASTDPVSGLVVYTACDTLIATMGCFRPVKLSPKDVAGTSGARVVGTIPDAYIQ